MPKKQVTSKKKATPKKAVTTAKQEVPTRVISPPTKFPRSLFKRSDKTFAPREPLPNVWHLSRAVALLLWNHRKTFISLALIYGILNIALVRGFAGGLNVSDLKDQIGQAFDGHFAALATSTSVFVTLVTTSGNTSSSTGGAYQTFLLVVMSLAVIWALRMTVAQENFRLRDSFYKGMYPLIPFLLVFVVIGLQLLPLLAGAGIYSTVVGNSIAVRPFEIAAWGIVCGLLAALSFYWLTASAFALYVVTLPNMTPLKSLRSARELVRGRRLAVARKLLFLPFALFLIAIIVMLPVILLAAPLAQWLFFFLTMCSLVVIHTYMYTVYRELLA